MLTVSVIALAWVIGLSGCGSGTTTTSSTGQGSSATTSTVATTGGGSSTTANSSGSFALGMSQLPGGVPVFGTSFFNSPVAVGTVSGQKHLPAFWSVTSGSKWSIQQIGTTERWPLAAFELNSQSIIGDRQLVVGQKQTMVLSVSPDGKTWTDASSFVPDFAKSAIINGIAETGSVDVLTGMDVSGNGAVWTVERASIK